MILGEEGSFITCSFVKGVGGEKSAITYKVCVSMTVSQVLAAELKITHSQMLCLCRLACSVRPT